MLIRISRDKIASVLNFNMFCLLLMICISIISCGIDSINYLSEDPISISSDGTSSFIFSIKESGSSSYLGVELFYRIYASQADADSDKSYITAKQSETDSVPGALIESQLKSSSGLRYLSPVVNDAIKIPILSKDDVLNEDDRINLSFYTGSIEPNYFIDHDDATFYTLKRNVSDESGDYKTFLDEPVAGDDSDFRSNNDHEDGDAYYVQFYAAAYGLDISSFEDLYGDAIYLGRITLNF